MPKVFLCFCLIGMLSGGNTCLYAQIGEQAARDYFAQALQAQQQGDEQRAIALYETLLKEGMVSSELYNNLGLAYRNAGRTGLALVQLERALRQDPSNADARHNLQVLKADVEANTIKPLQQMFLVRLWLGLRGSLSSGGWGTVFLLILWVSCLLWALNRRAGKGISNLRYLSPYLLLGLGFFVFVFAFQQRASEQDSRTAVVVRPQAGLRSEPDLGSPEALLLAEGQTLHIVEQHETWWLVELPNGTLGWLLASMVEKI